MAIDSINLYSYSRQAMVSNNAWKRHGCYRLGSEQYFNIPLENSLFGCHDDWNALDHFDPTTDSRLMFSHFNYLRTVYGSLQDGWALVQRGNWTNFIGRPGSNQTLTEVGLWSISRGPISGIQTVGGRYSDQVWLFYTNENTTKTYTYDCKDKLWISSPFVSGTVVKNVFAPYEEYTLQESLSSYNNDSKAPYFGCLGSVTMDPFGFKLLVPVAEWLAPPPMITKFTPGHDARILSNSTTVGVTLEFNTAMSCDGVTNAITLNMTSSGKGGTPTIGNVRCDATTGRTGRLPGAPVSAWYWSGTLSNFPDGILEIVVTNAPSSTGSTNVSYRFSFGGIDADLSSGNRPLFCEEGYCRQCNGLPRP
jgi:alpha-1,3-glucan synthase